MSLGETSELGMQRHSCPLACRFCCCLSFGLLLLAFICFLYIGLNWLNHIPKLLSMLFSANWFYLPWDSRHEPWALSLGPWAMSHEPLTINNRLINELFEYSSAVLGIRYYPRILLSFLTCNVEYFSPGVNFHFFRQLTQSHTNSSNHQRITLLGPP